MPDNLLVRGREIIIEMYRKYLYERTVSNWICTNKVEKKKKRAIRLIILFTTVRLLSLSPLYFFLTGTRNEAHRVHTDTTKSNFLPQQRLGTWLTCFTHPSSVTVPSSSVFYSHDHPNPRSLFQSLPDSIHRVVVTTLLHSLHQSLSLVAFYRFHVPSPPHQD